MLQGSVARRYAKAIFDIGFEQNAIISIVRDITRAADTWNSSEELQTSLSNPLINKTDRREIWSQTITRLAVSPTSRNFLLLLFDKGRLEYISSIARELGLLSDRKENRLRAEIRSSAPLDEANLTSLQTALQRHTGKTVVLTTEVDPDLLGGVVARIGDIMIDGSLKTKLQRVKEAMMEGK